MSRGPVTPGSEVGAGQVGAGGVGAGADVGVPLDEVHRGRDGGTLGLPPLAVGDVAQLTAHHRVLGLLVGLGLAAVSGGGHPPLVGFDLIGTGFAFPSATQSLQRCPQCLVQSLGISSSSRSKLRRCGGGYGPERPTAPALRPPRRR